MVTKLAFCILSLCTFTSAETIEILSPKPNLFLPIGVTLQVRWKVPSEGNKNEKCRVSLRDPSGKQKVLSTVAIKSGSTDVTLPGNTIPGDGYSIVLSSKEAGETLGSIDRLYFIGPLTEGQQVLLRKPLDWKPTLPISGKTLEFVDLPALQKVGISSLDITFKSSRPYMVGGFFKDDAIGATLPFTTKDTVEIWMRQKLIALFNDMGIEYSKESGVAVSIELFKFFVEERDQYNGCILGRTTISKGPKTLWTGMVRGTAGKWGSTYGIESYQECIADSFIQFGVSFLENMSIALQQP